MNPDETTITSQQPAASASTPPQNPYPAPIINKTVLMSGADYFNVVDINPYSHHIDSVDKQKAMEDFAKVRAAVEQAGIKVVKVDPPKDCQDGIFTANWGLCRDNTVVLSYLPNMRRSEMPYAEKILNDQGLRIVRAPYRFSGQGDALPCGDYLFVGSKYRTDPAMQEILAEELGYNVIILETIPELDAQGQPAINKLTGWPDSFFYDIDLALAVLTPDLIAWCPNALTPESQEKIRGLPFDKIEVSTEEAQKAFACNLISTGHVVVMSAHAPQFKAAIEAKGLKTITPDISTELGKAGGYIRCLTLTLDN